MGLVAGQMVGNGFHENAEEGTGHPVLAALSEFCNWSDDFDVHNRTNVRRSVFGEPIPAGAINTYVCEIPRCSHSVPTVFLGQASGIYIYI